MADQAIPAVSIPASTPAVAAIPAPAPQPVQATPTTATPTLTDANLHAAAQGLSTVVEGGQAASPRPVTGWSFLPGYEYQWIGF